MADKTPFVNEDEHFEITNVELRYDIKDTKRSSASEEVTMNIFMEAYVDNNDNLRFKFDCAEYHGSTIDQRDIFILDGLRDQLYSLGMTSKGLPSFPSQ